MTNISINTLQELVSALPLNAQTSGPCPFCEEGDEVIYDGVAFYGKDRFFLFPDNKGWGCRICLQKGRGPTNKGWYPHQAVAEIVNLELSDKFLEIYKSSGVYTTAENPLQYQTFAQALTHHKKVIRSYWYQFGWSDDTIDRFRLGYGHIDTWRTAGHLIPMDVTLSLDGSKIPGYYTALRAAGHKIKQKGSSKNYVWHIQDDPHLDTCVITEGEKDLITAHHLGYKNVLCSFSSYWNENFGTFVANRYKKVIIYCDNDTAGKSWLELVKTSLLSLGVSVTFLRWIKLEHTKEGDDLTDYYSRIKEIAACRKLLSSALTHKKSEIEHNPVNSAQVVPLGKIRGTEPGSLDYEIKYFLKNYTYQRGKGKSLLLSTGPGAGKTHTLYKIAEEQALTYKEKKMRELDRLQEMVDELDEELETVTEEEKVNLIPFVDKQKRLLEEYSFNSIAWYAPYKNGIEELLNMGADSSLWYNFQARSPDNCEAYSITDRLGENNHTIGKFCELSCPHSEQCKLSGYLYQKEEMRSYPIVFYRHEHLLGLPPSSNQLVVVDESVVKVVETPVVFNSDGLMPFKEGWELDVDDDSKVDAMKFFIKALRSVASFNLGEPQKLLKAKEMNPNYILHGNRVFSLLDKFYTSHDRELAEILLLTRGVIDAYQPSYLAGDVSLIKKRCLPFIVEALHRELGAYAYEKKADRPSTINIVAGTFEIYSPPRIKIPARMPLIIADATPLLELYQSIFKREMKVYSPVFRGDNTEIIVVYGSDWSRGYVDSQLGSHMVNFNKMRQKTDGLGVPQILDGYLKSSIFQDIIHVLEYLKKKHDSILMVTHKNLREFVESIIEGAYSGRAQKNDKSLVSWGHYGALRGTNKYKDYEALCLIGAFRIPYDVLWRKAQLWAYGLGLTESIPQTLIRKDQDYNHVGNSTLGSYLTFPHWLADKLVNHIERGEMIQCAHRIRPYSSDEKKTVYIFATRPITDLATLLLEKSKFLRSLKKTTYGELLSYLKRYYGETGRFPTYVDVKKVYKVSNSTIAEARKEVVNAEG